MRYIIYRRGFPYLDYPLEVSISWIYLLSPYNWSYHFCTSHYLMPLHVHVCLCTWHVFQYLLFDSDLSIHMCFPLHATWHSSYLSLGCFWQLQTGMPRFWSLELVNSQGCWSEYGMKAWIIGRQFGTLSFQAFCSSLEFPFITREHFLYCS